MKLPSTDRHVYIEAAFTETEARDLIDALETFTLDFLEGTEAIASFAAKLKQHLDDNPRYVTKFEYDSDLVLATRDQDCLSCEQNYRLPNNDRCQECVDQYGE